MTAEFSTMLLAILPEMCLLVLAGVLLVLDLTLREQPNRSRWLGWVTAGGLTLIAGLAVAFSQPGKDAVLTWGGMLRLDGAGFILRMIFLAGAALTALLVMELDGIGNRGEFYALLLVSVLGMSLMASSADLVMLYLAVETTSIPLYVLAGFFLREPRSVEAGLKYLLFGALASILMLFGFSLLYGFSGTTQIYAMAEKLAGMPFAPLLITGVLVLAGVAFKISAAPFHFWAPDVYEGAPTPVAGYLSTASKAAGFIVLLRLTATIFPVLNPTWSWLVAGLSAASMLVGNLLALAQKNIKRLLAYSSIAQAGYILIGVAAGTVSGSTAAVYYLMAYLLTNLAAFGVVTVVAKASGSDELSAFAGLSRRSPVMAIVLGIALLSLGGIPPFGGFFAKLWVFGAGLEAGWLWLVIIGLVTAIIGLYYYLTILKVMYLYRSEDETKPLVLGAGWKLVLLVCAVGIVVLGVVIVPFYQWAGLAAAGLH